MNVLPKIITNLPDIYRCDYEGSYSHPNSACKHLQNLSQTGIYYDTLQSIAGCDSILSLRFFWGTRTYSTLNTRVCEGELPWLDPNSALQLWHDTTYNDTISNVLHCDSVITVNFSVAKAYTVTIDTTICEMQLPYNHPDKKLGAFQNLTQSGTYKQVTPTMDECDSTVILHLMVNPTTYTYVKVVECESNLPYIYGEHHKQAMVSGEYRDTLISRNQYGCDSILVVQLTVLNTILDVQYDTVCSTYIPYNHADIRAAKLQGLTTTGVYKDTLSSISGCDSVIELHLFVPQAYYGLNEKITLCDNEELPWNDLHLLGSWGHDTIIIDTLHTIYGCDSVITLGVNIYPSYEFIERGQICWDGDYEWRGNHYNITGVYYDSLFTQKGCDSVYILELYVKPSIRYNIDTVVCKNETLMHTDTAWYPYKNRYSLQDYIVWEPGRYKAPSIDIHYSDMSGTCDTVVYRYYIIYCDTFYQESVDTICSVDEIKIHDNFTYHLSNAFDVDEYILPYDTIVVDSLQTTHGCDSIYAVKLKVFPKYHHIDSISICLNDTFQWDTRGIYYQNNGFVSPGDYVFWDSLMTTTDSVVSCDSIYELRLHVCPTYNNHSDILLCHMDLPFVSGLVTLKESDLHCHTQVDTVYTCGAEAIVKKYLYWDVDTMFAFTTYEGCDSICSFHVEVYDTTSHVVVDTICESETYTIDCGNGDYRFTQTGQYIIKDINRWGCQHTIYLNLIVIPKTHFVLSMPDICLEDEELTIGYDFQGRPLVEYSVYFDSLGHSQGFEDIIHAPIPDTVSRYITIPIPFGEEIPRATHQYFDSRVGMNQYVYDTKYCYPQPDAYPMRIVMHNGICSDPLQTMDTTIEMLYPAWIHEQHWNDGIVLYNETYNGGYEYSAYQWYYNDEPIIGQVREFLYLSSNLELNPRGLSTTDDCPNKYRVLLTRKSDGHQNFTCPICPVLIEDTIVPRKEYFSIVPTLVVKENPVVWILATMPGSFVMTNEAGMEIKSGSFAPDKNNYAGEIYLPNTCGVYIITLFNDLGDTRTCKVLVK